MKSSSMVFLHLLFISITYFWKADKLNFKRKADFENSKKKENVEIKDNLGCSYTCLCSVVNDPGIIAYIKWRMSVKLL